MVKLNNVTQTVESNLCEDAGLPTPITIQKCDTNECPHWIVHDWQDCNTSRCFAWNTGIKGENSYLFFYSNLTTLFKYVLVKPCL